MDTDAFDKYGTGEYWQKNQDKITLVCTSHNPNMNLFQKMLDSTYSREGQLFDDRIIHWNEKLIRVSRGKEEKIISHTGSYSIADAYNSLIEKFVETEWICCFCDDDYFYPEGLTNMITEIKHGNARDYDVAHFKFHISGYVPPQDKRCWFGRREYDLCEKKPITPKLLEKHNRMPAGSFFRKSAWEKVNGFQGDKFHDWDLWKRMSQAGCKFKYFDHVVYNMVRRPTGAWLRQNAGLHQKP